MPSCTAATGVSDLSQIGDTFGELSVLGELRAQGATDYLITPLPFIGGETHAGRWCDAMEIRDGRIEPETLLRHLIPPHIRALRKRAAEPAHVERERVAADPDTGAA